MKKFYNLLLLFAFAAFSATQAASPSDQLVSAIYQQDPAGIKAAIKAGANPNGGNYGGHYLGLAANIGSKKAVQALVESGADVNQASYGGWTAAMAAADNGHLDVLKYLASKKSNLNAKTRMGRTVLMRASGHGQTAVVKYLLAHGAKVNDVDNAGATALMLAAQQGQDTTVQALLKSGADKRLVLVNKKTAQVLAEEAAKASGAYRAKEYAATIKLLAAKSTQRTEKSIGKVTQVKGDSITITGKDLRKAKRGTQISIKTSGGAITATVKKTGHKKIQATADQTGVAKGDSAYLE